MATGVIVLGHGSRQADANGEFESLVSRFRARRPDLLVRHGYIELAEPLLPAALEDLARHCTQVVVLPVFLFSAGHIKDDVPQALAAIRQSAPGVSFVAARPFGVHPVLTALASRQLDAGGPIDPDQARRTALVVVGRGSSDPDANGDLYKVMRLLAEGRGFGWVLPCFIGITWPTVEETLMLAAQLRPQRVAVLPYFLFRGLLVDRLGKMVEDFTARHPWVQSRLVPHLGADDSLLPLMDEMVHDALDGKAPLPCVTCQYRRPETGMARGAGESRAWS